MKAYKGFDKDLKCRDFQYEIGKEYKTDKADLCRCGFHACEAPLDVFNYYSPADSRFCEVELEDVTDQKDGDTKCVGKKIKIGAEIGVKGLINAFAKFIFEKAKPTTGNYAHSATTGYAAHSATTGYAAHSATTGKYANSATTGDNALSSVGDTNSVAVSVGKDGAVKGCINSAIVCAERGKWDGEGYPLIGIKAAIVDGETIKPDTWYTLKNGEFVEVENET